MKLPFSFLSLLSLSTFTTAQIPTCATTCISDAVASTKLCGASDIFCQCQPDNLSEIVQDAAPCVIADCPDPLAVLSAADEACSSILASASPTFAPELSAATPAVALSSTDPTTSDPPVAASSTADPTTSDPPTPTDPSNTTAITGALSYPVPSNGTSTSTSPPIQVSAGAGVKVGLERAGSVFAVGVAVLAAL